MPDLPFAWQKPQEALALVIAAELLPQPAAAGALDVTGQAAAAPTTPALDGAIPGVASPRGEGGAGAPGSGVPADVAPANVAILVQFGAGVSAAAREAALSHVGGRAAEMLLEHGGPAGDLGALMRISFGGEAEADAGIRILSQRPGVAFAERDWAVSIQATSNDPAYTGGSLWGMEGDATSPANQYGSQAGEAWAAGLTGAMRTVIGIIDTGIDYRHQDLYQNIWLNQREIPVTLKASLSDIDGDGLITFRDLNDAANAGTVTDLNANGRIDAGDLLADARWEDGVDQDGNGYLDDLIGWDFVNNDNDPFDDNSHGTHVAGTIGGIGGNGLGVAGVNWSIQMVGLKFLAANGSGSTSNAALAATYFAQLGEANTGAGALPEDFVATSNSWGGGGFSQTMLNAIVRGAQADQLFVAAAGNGGSDGIGDNNDTTANYPSNYSTTAGAGYEAVVAVAAMTSSGGLASYSNYGPTTVDLGAPGSSIYSTVPGDAYGSKSGTSMATPHVTGAIALYASAHMDASAADIRAALLSSTAATASLAGKTVTGGRLDIGQMLAPDVTPPTVAVTLSDSTLTAGETATVTFAFSEQVSGFSLDDIAYDTTTGTLGTLSSADQRTFTAVFTPAAGISDATNTIAVIAGSYTDPAGNAGEGATSANFAIDTSAPPPNLMIYGTTASDTLVGGAGNDTISGIPATGSNLGRGTVDRLTGGAGADLFVLGDARGAFYNDGNAKNAGNGDYALVTDFSDGIDHLQLMAGSYFVRAVTVGSVTGAGIYLDTNGSGAWDNKDELIGVLQSVAATSISGQDVIFV